MDANVITIENSISDEKLLSLFREEVIYITGIGPGVYSIHSPRIPPTEEICLSDFLSRVDVVNDHPWTPESRLVTVIRRVVLSRKEGADIRRCMKGQFVKAGRAYDYDPLSQTRRY
ncbi:hypothetical protein RYX36_024919 [Vicia faba]